MNKKERTTLSRYSADKACKTLSLCPRFIIYNCILNQLDINSALGNPNYSPTAHSKDEIL
jgi:hypothetical protein